jgi:hypothetical protein
MSAAAVHLSVDIGAWWTAAVLHAGGRREPVTADGQPRIASGVFLDPAAGVFLAGAAGLAAAQQQPGSYVTGPLAHLHSDAAGTTGHDPVVAVSALLAYVANIASVQAGAAITTLAVTTPRAWGHRSRDRLTQAATMAGLPAPQIVTTAAATAAHLTPDGSPDGAPGSFVLVCATGDTDMTLTILDTGDHYTQLATATINDPTAPPIDQVLTDLAWQRAGADPAAVTTASGWQVAAEVRQARTALATQHRAPILLPAPHPAVVIDRDDLAAAAKSHFARLPETLTQVLADADLDRAAITASVITGDDPVTTDVHGALTDAGFSPTLITGQPHAIADGAARLTHDQTASAGTATAATTRLPRVRLSLRNITSTAVLAVTSVILLFQAVYTTEVWTLGITIQAVDLPIPQLSLSAALAVLAAISAASLAPTTWLTPAGLNDPHSTGYLLRRAYLAAAVTGLALAVMWGLGAATAIEYPRNSGLYTRWALTTATPIAVCAALIALISPRIPAERLAAWLQVVAPPVIPLVVGAAGLFLRKAAGTLTFPVSTNEVGGVVSFIALAMLGAATPAVATRARSIRILTGGVLAIGYPLITGPYWGVKIVTIIFIGAILWWVLQATTRTVLYAVPGVEGRLSRWIGT